MGHPVRQRFAFSKSRARLPYLIRCFRVRQAGFAITDASGLSVAAASPAQRHQQQPALWRGLAGGLIVTTNLFGRSRETESNWLDCQSAAHTEPRLTQGFPQAFSNLGANRHG